MISRKNDIANRLFPITLVVGILLMRIIDHTNALRELKYLVTLRHKTVDVLL